MPCPAVVKEVANDDEQPPGSIAEPTLRGAPHQASAPGSDAQHCDIEAPFGAHANTSAARTSMRSVMPASSTKDRAISATRGSSNTVSNSQTTLLFRRCTAWDRCARMDACWHIEKRGFISATLAWAHHERPRRSDAASLRDMNLGQSILHDCSSGPMEFFKYNGTDPGQKKSALKQRNANSMQGKQRSRPIKRYGGGLPSIG